MFPPFRAFLILACLGLFVGSLASEVCCQELSAAGSVASDDQPEPLAFEIVEALEQEVEQSTELDEQQKQRLVVTLGQVKAELGRTVEVRDSADRFAAWSESAERDLKAAREDRTQIQPLDLESLPQALNELVKLASELDQQLADAKQALASAQAEPQRRVKRESEIPEELAAATTTRSQLDEKLAAAQADSQESLDARAQLMLLRAQRQKQDALIASLNQERGAYLAQGELPRLRIDYLTARVRQLEQDILRLVDLVTIRRKTDAGAQRTKARDLWEAVSDPMKPFAAKNLEWVNRRLELAEEIQQAAAVRDKTAKKLTRWEEEFERTKKRTDSLGAKSLGLLLADKRSSLPSVSLLEYQIEAGESRLAALQTELYQLEDRRSELSAADLAVNEMMEPLISKGELPAEAWDELSEIVALESSILDSLLKDAGRHYSLKIASRADQQELVDVLSRFTDYINRNILWVPSSKPLRLSHLEDSGRAIWWLANFSTISDSIRQVGRFLIGNPLRSIVFLAVIATLFLLRKKMKSQLAELGLFASSISCRTMRPTVRALLITAGLALPWSLVCWMLGRMLAGAGSEAVRGLSQGFSETAPWLLTFEFLRQMLRTDGLADAHFQWSEGLRSKAARAVRLMVPLGTPLVFVATAVELHGDPDFRVSVGRLCLIGVLLLISWSVFQLAQSRPGDRGNLWLGLIAAGVLCPVVMAVAAAIGYQYTVYELTLDLVLTLLLVIALLGVRAMGYRWVKMKRRSIRFQQLIEARAARSDDTESQGSDIDTLVAKEESTDLVVMDRQSRRLIDLILLAVGLAGGAMILMELNPALTPVLDAPINPFRIAAESPVTVGAMLLALFIAAVAVLAWQNVPGLIDVLLLGRLGVESSVRYAVTTLSQYAILIAGVVCTADALGLHWDHVRWLVAAMGVGLGFGLQEVVANFVCGVLLLFERPIRVGDIVTLGDTTGVVIRIRSRATTVRNWDRQEVIIPNKELITGRITNWDALRSHESDRDPHRRGLRIRYRRGAASPVRGVRRERTCPHRPRAVGDLRTVRRQYPELHRARLPRQDGRPHGDHSSTP